MTNRAEFVKSRYYKDPEGLKLITRDYSDTQCLSLSHKLLNYFIQRLLYRKINERLWSNHQNPGHILSPALFQPTGYKVIHINTATEPKAPMAKWQGGVFPLLFWGVFWRVEQGSRSCNSSRSGICFLKI